MKLWPKCPNAHLCSRNNTFAELKSVKVEMNQDSNKSQTYLLSKTVQWAQPQAKVIKTEGSFYPWFVDNSQIRITCGSNEINR